MYFDGPVGWQKVVDALNKAADKGEAAGFDSEFYGWDWQRGQYDPTFDIEEISPVNRTRIHVFSVAVLLDDITARGHRRAYGAVLPESALGFVPLLDWLTSGRVKCIHNLPADSHTLYNHGIELGGGRDTVSVARWCWPERASLPPRSKPYALKTLAQAKLGVTEVVEFDTFMVPRMVEVERTKTVKRCECGTHPCRRKSTQPGHARVAETTSWTEVTQRGVQPVDLRTLVPGHGLWGTYIKYAAADAVWALEINDLALRTRREVIQPW